MSKFPIIQYRVAAAVYLKFSDTGFEYGIMQQSFNLYGEEKRGIRDKKPKGIKLKDCIWNKTIYLICFTYFILSYLNGKSIRDSTFLKLDYIINSRNWFWKSLKRSSEKYLNRSYENSRWMLLVKYPQSLGGFEDSSMTVWTKIDNKIKRPLL